MRVVRFLCVEREFFVQQTRMATHWNDQPCTTADTSYAPMVTYPGCEAGFGWSLSTGVGCCKKGSTTQLAELESCKQNWGNTNCLHGPDGHASGNNFGTGAAIQLDPETKLPVGSYLQSCRGCVYDAPLLSCEVCQDGQHGCRGDNYNGCGTDKKTTADLTGCDAGKIENEHGQLAPYCPGGGGHRSMPGG